VNPTSSTWDIPPQGLHLLWVVHNDRNITNLARVRSPRHFITNTITTKSCSSEQNPRSQARQGYSQTSACPQTQTSFPPSQASPAEAALVPFSCAQASSAWRVCYQVRARHCRSLVGSSHGGVRPDCRWPYSKGHVFPSWVIVCRNRWLCVPGLERDHSKHRKMPQRGSVRVYSKALVEANENIMSKAR